MFGKRPDATLVRDLSTMRRFMPYVSPRRNDSLFLMNQEIGAEAAFEFIAKKNKERPRNRPITLFHLYMRALSMALLLRPGVNRFIKAGRVWQRDGVWITFSAKRKLIDGSPMITIKRRFHPESETLDEMVDATYELLRAGRRGKQTTSDKEMKWMLRLPGPLIRLALAIQRLADHFGLLPRKMIDADPLYTSVFLANLGSIDYPAGFPPSLGVRNRVCVWRDGKDRPRNRWKAKVHLRLDVRRAHGRWPLLLLLAGNGPALDRRS